MRFGVVGTGSWARRVHLVGLGVADGADPVAVWGRDPSKVAALAEAEGLAGFTEIEAFFEAVDAVAFAVPPEVQVSIGTQAARSGKHLLLEKPIALRVEDARQLEVATEEAGVASVVFVTAAYSPERRAWVQRLEEIGPARGACGVFLSGALSADSPFNTPWRREKGALWDIGPHILASLEDALGPVQEVVAAVAGERDLVHLVLRHHSGATSTATATIDTDPRIHCSELVVWTDQEVTTVPPLESNIPGVYATAVSELIASAESGAGHRYDVHDGRRIVELLAAAERLLR